MSPMKRIAVTIGAVLVLVSAACTSPPPVDPEPTDPPPTVDVSVGKHHSCAVRDDGTVHCWGRNDMGQLGDGTTTDRATPVQVAGVHGAVSVSAGGFHSCAVLSDGFSQCWGHGGSGQLGDGNGRNSLVPVSPRGLIEVAEIVTGFSHTCARTRDGRVSCWGSSIGQGSDRRSSSTPVEVGLPSAIDLGAGDDRTCAVLVDTTVRCWGEANNWGQLGDGTTVTTRLPVMVSGLTSATSVSASEHHGCASLADGTVQCWGVDGGRFGATSVVSFSSVPVSVDGVTDATSVVAGRTESCARGAGGVLRCWGPSAVDPSAVGATYDVALSTGGHGCAVLTDGSVRCWGSRTYGQLGNGDGDMSSPDPIQVGALEPAASVAAGGESTCAQLATGALRCWGLNEQWQLGNSRVGDPTAPVPVLTYRLGAPGGYREELVDVVAVEAGTGHTCALLEDETMKCWGRNALGQVGDGSSGDRREPAAPRGLSSAVDLSAGGSNSCAVKRDGSAWCWGLAPYRIGSPTAAFVVISPLPQQVSNLSDATSIDTGPNHTCVIRTAGKVSCWGADDGNHGVLGQSVFFGSTSPLEIGGLEGAVEVAAGGQHSCALLTDGTVRCWGGNAHGQLGDGSSVAKSYTPVTVSGIQDAVAVSAGDHHSCALMADGTTRCWGGNSHGQLGDGTRADARSPVDVPGVSGVADIDAGRLHTCAVAVDGASWCWGANGSRQLGTGASFTSPPVQVLGFP